MNCKRLGLTLLAATLALFDAGCLPFAPMTYPGSPCSRGLISRSRALPPTTTFRGQTLPGTAGGSSVGSSVADAAAQAAAIAARGASRVGANVGPVASNALGRAGASGGGGISTTTDLIPTGADFLGTSSGSSCTPRG